jgi:hypothetical protein
VSDEEATAAFEARLFAKLDTRDMLHAIHLDVVALRGETRTSTTSLDAMSKLVHGNGTPGLRTHVDRLIQEAADRRWRDRMLWGVSLSTAATVLLQFVLAQIAK